MTSAAEVPVAIEEAATQEQVAVTTASSGLRSLNPADGLFLRAEHLNQIQEYARQLSRVVAIAGGSGVAYGYQLSVSGSQLAVSPGLAISPAGHPLRSRAGLTLDLSQLAPQQGRFWVVEVTGAPPEPAGSEPVFGELCADPCSAGGSIQPWLDEAVRVQVTPNDSLAGVLGQDPRYQRSELASAYFEQERRAGGPWLTPGVGGGGAVAPLLGLPWQSAAPEAEPVADGAVPIGALLLVEGDWVLDVWAARRDLVAPPARSGWEAHLGWRPWEVFLAQILQFQAQLAVAPQAQSAGIVTIGGAEHLYEELLRHPPRSKRAVQDVWDRFREQSQAIVYSGTLADQGFRELPPAGFLPIAGGGPDVEDRIRTALGAVQVTVRHSSADAALRAVSEAQHLDRIPLGVVGDGKNPAVEVWVPDVPADLPEVFTQAYGWVAFVRDRERCATVAPQPPPSVDQVAVYVLDLTSDETPETFAERLAKEFAATVKAAGDPVATLTYPAAEWAVPAGQDQRKRVLDAYALRSGNAVAGPAPMTVIGTAAGGERRPLALLRAELLEVWLTGNRPNPAARALLTAADAATFVIGADTETIWLVFTSEIN